MQNIPKNKTSLLPFSDLILVNNHHFIAFNKPGGMAVQSVKNKEESLEVKLYHYCKTPLYIIHRIDQPCSGIVLFAKKKTTAAYLTEILQQFELDRTYIAICHGKPEQEEGTLRHYLFAHKKSNKSFVVDADHKEGKLAELDYKYIGETEKQYHAIEIKLKTGRHHQIRAQLGAIGCPIVGDTKYGSKAFRVDQSILLHAWKMDFKHPVDHKQIDLVASFPDNEIWRSIRIN